ncbi:enoyl-CoA hydratase-related protein [Variovorax sp. LjRoot175]|uniref:enoyl-CoA hydratase/isomerase family protein n=1 Tax=Variovorax sp. LjRoot175 TaxID=3342276 RepID=UPI003ECE14A2
MSEPVILQREGAVARLRFNRPAQLNAVNVPMARAFLACCQAIAASPDIRAVVLSGEGDVFGVGGDLNELAGDDAASAVPGLIGPVHEAVKLMARLDVPFIARLHGVVAGGSLSLAMACDLAIAAEGTKFNLAYVNIGATCDGSASWSLPRVAGMRNAMAIALLGESFDAAEAWRYGLVNKVVPLAELDAGVDAVAQRLAAGPTLAIGRMKRLIRASLENDLPTQLDLEQEEFVANARTEDFTGAVAAFLQKQRPRFNGR